MKLSVIGYGNMAKAIVSGFMKSARNDTIYAYDVIPEAFDNLSYPSDRFIVCSSVNECVSHGDLILLSVKPQNLGDLYPLIRSVLGYDKKVYLSICAGVSSAKISENLSGARIIRALPNLPMTIGFGMSLLCKNPSIPTDYMDKAKELLGLSGDVLEIEEKDMNRYIGVTSSSPAYFFRFIAAMRDAAIAQGLPEDDLIRIICQSMIGSATLAKEANVSPEELERRVTSKGGTTERAMKVFTDHRLNDTVSEAMVACTERADELAHNS